MARKRNRTNPLVEGLILTCADGRVTSREAQKAVRALCKHYGGQFAYVPLRKEDGESARKLRGVVADAAGDDAAEEIVSKIMRLYGGTQIYFPMERNAFAATIALEIYERYDGNETSMSDIAREYGISVVHAYRLWAEGRQEKFERSMPYLPFLELGEDNNPG